MGKLLAILLNALDSFVHPHYECESWTLINVALILAKWIENIHTNTLTHRLAYG